MTRSSKDETEARVKEALRLLIDGFTPASITRSLQAKHGVSIRQARRYTTAAQLDLFDAPMTRNELEFGLALQVERLDLIADKCSAGGDLKMEIQAIKAGAKLREDRLKALQREAEFIDRVGKFSR